MMQNSLCILAVLVLFWTGGLAQLQVQAQSGYNYGRPEVASVGGATAGGRLTPGPYPTAAALPLTPAPATTAYGGAGLFPSPAVGFTPTGQATTAFGAPAAVGPSSGISQQRRPSQGGIQSTSSRSGPYGPQTPQYGNAPGGSAIRLPSGTGGGDAGDYSDGDGDYSAIPGVPGVDYPIYAQVPRTNFDCSQQALPGYYADIEAQCQVFHICALNRTYSFLCPNGTVFSQETLVCVWWNQYDCVSAPSLYANNAYIYDYSERGASNLAAQPSANAYRPGAASTTAFGAPVATTGTLRATGVPSQVTGYSAGRGSYPSATPTPAVQAQSPYGASAVLRPGIVPGGGTNRLAPTAAAAGLLATAAGALPDNSLAAFGQQQQQPQVVGSGNREYLPPASAGQQRQRVGSAA